MKSSICINALALRTGGGLSYVAELIPHIRRLYGAQATRVLITRTQATSLGWAPADGVVVLPDFLSRPALRIAFEVCVLPIALVYWRCRSVLMCGNLGLPFCSVRQVVVQHASFNAAAASKTVFQGLRWNLKRILSRFTSRSAQAVVYVSNALQEELVALGFPQGRVIWHGVNPIYHPVAPTTAHAAVKAKHGLANPFILCVADIYPHKNLALALRVLHALRQGSHPAMALVLAGAPEDTSEVSRLEELSVELGLTPHVHMIGRVDREDLRSLYNAAEAVLAPSSAESFGMPILEALRCGVPVVCSRIPAFVEVAAAAGIFFEVDNVEEATRSVLVAMTLERPYQRGIEHAVAYSWETAAAMTLDVLVCTSADTNDAQASGYWAATGSQQTTS